MLFSSFDQLHLFVGVTESLIVGTCDARHFASPDGGAGLADDVGAEAEADQVERVQRRRRHGDQQVDEGAHVVARLGHVDHGDVRVVDAGRQRRPVHRDEVALFLLQVRYPFPKKGTRTVLRQYHEETRDASFI